MGSTDDTARRNAAQRHWPHLTVRRAQTHHKMERAKFEVDDRVVWDRSRTPEDDYPHAIFNEQAVEGGDRAFILSDTVKELEPARGEDA